MKDNIKKLYPFQYYTIRNVDLLEQNGFNFNDYSFNKKHSHELYIGNINGLICRHSYGMPIKMGNYLIENDNTKLTFLLPENYRACIDNLRGMRKSVTDYFDAESLKDRITVVTYKVDNSDIIDKVAELGANMKFDCVIMNPPYDKSLHLKIFKEVLSFCDKVVNISPVRWLQDPFAQEKRSELKRFENSICKKLNNVEIVNCHEASIMFGINVYSDLGIYTSGSGFDYVSFWKIGRAYHEISIINKICNNITVDKLNKHVINNDVSKGTYVLISSIAGGRGNKPIYKYNGIVHDGSVDDNIDFLTAWNTNPRHTAWRKQNYLCDSIKFTSVIEAENFYNSYNTKVLTYVCKISCQQQNIQLQKLPFMQDYSQPWTDKRLCEYFNITGYISDTEAEPGSEWETILNAISH